MEIQKYEELILIELKKVTENILIKNPQPKISAKSRAGAEISSLLEEQFVLETSKHKYFKNSAASPDGSTKNPWDAMTHFSLKNHDEVIWIDFKAVKVSSSDSNPDIGTPDKIIDNTWGDYGCYERGSLAGGLSTYKFQPRSSYWGLYELSNYFSIPGSGNNNLVSAVVSSAPKLDVYANKRCDNRTSLLVINRDSLHTVNTTVNLIGFVPISNADVYTFSSANYVWHANSYAHPDTLPTHSTISAGTSFNISFPPYSLNVVVLSQKTINSIEEISDNEFSIYTNPSNEHITLTNPGSEILKIQIFNLSGMTLIDITTSNPVLNVQYLPSGMYILKVNNQFIKFIKQ